MPNGQDTCIATEQQMRLPYLFLDRVTLLALSLLHNGTLQSL